MLRTEATDYNGNILYTGYSYDDKACITTIMHAANGVWQVDTVTISYSGNETILHSFPKTDPSYNTTKEVHLTLDASGKLL